MSAIRLRAGRACASTAFFARRRMRPARPSRRSGCRRGPTRRRRTGAGSSRSSGRASNLWSWHRAQAERQAEEDRADRPGDLGQLRLPLDGRVDVPADHLARAAAAESGGDQRRSCRPARPRRPRAGGRRSGRRACRRSGALTTQSRYRQASGRSASQLESVRVGVMGQVEPVLGPPLAVAGTGEQAIDEPLVGVGRGCRRGMPRPRPGSAAGRSGRSVTRRISADPIGLGRGPEADPPRARPG